METVNNEVKKSNKAKGLMIVLLSFLIALTGILFFLLHRDTIYKVITIEGIEVGGLPIQKAQQRIEDNFQESATHKKIIFTFKDKVWDIHSNEIGYTYDYKKAVQEAYKVGREGSYFKRLQEIMRLYKAPQNISLLPIYDHDKLDTVITTIQEDIDRPTQNATVMRKNGRFIVKKEESGLQLDTNRLKNLIQEDMKKYKDQNEVHIMLPVKIQHPKITSENLSQIKDLLGTYSTQFNSQKKERSQNIALAAKTMNGTVLMPGEIFSFNKVVGPRTKDKGYQNAPVIVNGELIEGLGGGVCQVSSTIYNAALISNLKIVERTKHTIPSSYVPKGRDATVSYGVLDFKFQNNFSYPIYIESYAGAGRITVNLYGYKTDHRTIKIESGPEEVVKRPVEVQYDSNVPEGVEQIKQRGRDGYKVGIYKVTYENQKEIERKQISKDFYKPQKQIVIKGNKKISKSSEQPSKPNEQPLKPNDETEKTNSEEKPSIDEEGHASP